MIRMLILLIRSDEQKVRLRLALLEFLVFTYVQSQSGAEQSQTSTSGTHYSSCALAKTEISHALGLHGGGNGCSSLSPPWHIFPIFFVSSSPLLIWFRFRPGVDSSVSTEETRQSLCLLTFCIQSRIVAIKHNETSLFRPPFPPSLCCSPPLQ